MPLLGGACATDEGLLIGGSSPDPSDHDCRRVFHVAAELGHGKVICALLNSSANKDSVSGYEWTRLMLAVRNDHLATVKTLLAAEADVGRYRRRRDWW